MALRAATPDLADGSKIFRLTLVSSPIGAPDATLRRRSADRDIENLGFWAYAAADEASTRSRERKH
jgi:hypothetical protein